MRPLAAGLCVVLSTIAAAACGGSTSVTAPRARTTVTAAAPTTTAPATTADSAPLARSVARAFGAAVLAGFLATPAPTTLSQIPPRADRLVPEPPTVCTRLRPGVYRCSVGSRTGSGSTGQRVDYVVRRERGCFTAIAAALPSGNSLHRLHGCPPSRTHAR